MKSLRRTSTPIVWAMLLMVVLSACGNAAPRSTATDPASNTSAETTATATSGNTLEAIKSAGVLKVGLMGTYAPYNFLNANKEVDGFDADIAKEVAKRLGVKAEFTTQAFSGLIPSLQAGKFDAIISQVTITDERKQQLDFSDPYITNQVKIIVNANNTDITKLADFKDKNIGVGLGTNDETYLRTEVLPQVGNFNIKTYNDVITSLQDLNVGRIDATINNIYALKPIVEENGFKIKAVGDAIKSDQAGIAIRKDNPDLLKALNKALTDMKADGTYETIFVKWFGEKPAAE
ncbi:transporter substrate-binding domain-containing protein [Paenibacillus kyungheensis]|uniref:Transporter substrate-binding domain-containing protein n=1 Tax=Paenibacillus kyungheensis TaxID=1452732 RepID=A0AAX3M2C7_9BACL|nr:transporter substrate-binding domain-containing protein [Paenibacillus kyungheensis]WCT56247.1 transporter substrate-binding domain-containing protein [Paenibacillus kyungheensis]